MRYLRVVAISLLVLGALSPVASAAPGGAHCAYHLDPVSRQGRVVKASSRLIGCYASFAQAISEGTGGAVRLDASASPSTLTDAALGDPVPLASSVLIGTEYVDATYGGASASYYASATCSSTTTWEVAYVTDAWNDVFSSGQGFGGCDHNKKFEASNFGGSVLTCTPNCTYYGALSDLVSSLRWKP